MSRKWREYSEQEREIALIFYETVKNKPDPFAVAAKHANVEETALRYWVAGGKENNLGSIAIEDSDEEDDEWEAPEIPLPPDDMQSVLRYPEDFCYSHELDEWVRYHYIENEDGLLYDTSFNHLKTARIAWEWTNVENFKNMKGVAGMEQLVGVSGNRWDKAREVVSLKKEWGKVPDFRITLDSVFWSFSSDATRCALIDHELRHCALKINPRTREICFDPDGKPIFALVGHDFEGFLGTMRRFGWDDAPEAGAKQMAEIIQVVGRNGPAIARASIASACGTCRR